MAWYLDGHRIYVEKDSGWAHAPRIGEINILDSSQTIIHTAGRPSYTRDIVFVIFSGYHASILPITDGALVSDQGAEGDVVVKGCDAERLQDIKRTTAVFRVTMSLVKDGI